LALSLALGLAASTAVAQYSPGGLGVQAPSAQPTPPTPISANGLPIGPPQAHSSGATTFPAANATAQAVQHQHPNHGIIGVHPAAFQPTLTAPPLKTGAQDLVQVTDGPSNRTPVRPSLRVAQARASDFSADDEALLKPSPETRAKVKDLIADIIEPELILEIDPRKSKLIRTKEPVSRFSVTHPNRVEVVQFSPTEFELIGGDTGETTLTLWFGDQPATENRVLRYLVRVSQDTTTDDLAEVEYGKLQDKINELFPNSMIQLIPVADKLIVRGQARDAEEAAQIMSILGASQTNQQGYSLGPQSFINVGTVARPTLGATDLPASNLISLLDVPGEQQIMLKVRVAELSRSAMRNMGANFAAFGGEFLVNSNLSVNGAINAVLSTDDLLLALQATKSNAYSKILAEPNLITLNGRPASFVAGGQFAVPTVVGVEGAAAATTFFQSFGTQLFFIPTIIDKDRIRLQVTPTISSINTSNSVGGIPGLNTKTVSTTVDLREGQWLALAGLLEDQQSGSKTRVPLAGDIPILDAVFSRKTSDRSETELIILVSPELVSPLEAEEVPLILPGMEVTEPADWTFYLFGRYEGNPNCQHRSTVAPLYQDDVIRARMAALHDAKLHRRYQQCEDFYVHGDHGFSR
jgi:pilus assembly protein CpaC